MVGIDLVVIGIIVIFALVGYKKGIVKSILNLASFFVAIVFSKMLSPMFVEKVLKDMFHLDQVISNFIQQKFVSSVTGGIDNITEQLENTVVQGFSESVSQTAMTNIQNITDSILNWMSVILIFIAITLVLKVVIFLVNAIVKVIPVVKQLNDIGGFVIGSLKGLLFIWIVMALIPTFANVQGVDLAIQSINDSSFSKYLFENNKLVEWLFNDGTVIKPDENIVINEGDDANNEIGTNEGVA